MEFIEKFEENCKKYPDVIALKSVTDKNGISYKQLNEQSARIYAYLKKHGISKEKMVFICLPRDTLMVVAMIGAIKAGVAFTLCENLYPQDRIEFIKKDFNCVLTIDEQTYLTMMKEAPLYGHEVTLPHDACFAVYTSGSTGNPKGVLHEYGKLTQMAESWYLTKTDIPVGSVFIMFAPFNFVAAPLIILGVLFSGRCLFIAPYSIAKDVNKLLKLLEEEDAKQTFLSLGILKLCKDKLPEGLIHVFAGGEAYNNICLSDKFTFTATYCSSEAAFLIATFDIKQEYDRTPSGKNTIGVEILILDDKGNKLTNGKIGEICYKNEFTRGYINLPEKTAEVFVNGIYHSGDLGYIGEDGNLFVCGRKDEMIKISGNRIEPAEIESAIKKEFGLDNVVAKGFQGENRNFICVYFLKEEMEKKNYLSDNGSLLLNRKEFFKRLNKKLPYYMIPAYYSVLSSYPTNTNGKLDKKQLEAPKVESLQKEYIAPSNEIEEKLCNAFAAALDIKQVSVDDDFYEIGGDSITTIMIISELRLDSLDVNMFLQGRTPRNIAKLYEESIIKGSGNLEKRNEKALKVDHPLSNEQMIMFDYQLEYPTSTLWNLPILLKFKSDVDIKRLKKTVDTVLKAHPVFSLTYVFNEKMQMVQRFDSEKVFDTPIERMSELDFIGESKKLIQPFKLLQQPMYRVRIFSTESGGYLFFDLHHSIADGTSIQILIRDICDVYSGNSIPPDYYFVSCEEREKKKKSLLNIEAKVYYKNLFDMYEWDCSLKTDMKTNKNVNGNVSTMLPIDDVSYKKLFDKYGIGKNEFYIATAALAISKYNGSSNIRLSWVYHGRQSVSDNNVVGALIRDLFVGVRFNDRKTLKDLFKDIKEQTDKNINYSFFQYPDLGQFNQESDDVTVIYQANLKNLSSNGILGFTVMDIPGNNAFTTNLLNIEIQEVDGGYKLSMDYNACAYKKESINVFQEIFIKTACLLIENLDNPEIKVIDILNYQTSHH